MLREHDRLPADAILLAAEEKKLFLQTAQLDGETSLKTRIVPVEWDEVNDLKGRMRMPPPDPDLNRFSATLRFNGEKIIPLSEKNFLPQVYSMLNPFSIILNMLHFFEDLIDKDCSILISFQ